MGLYIANILYGEVCVLMEGSFMEGYVSFMEGSFMEGYVSFMEESLMEGYLVPLCSAFN